MPRITEIETQLLDITQQLNYTYAVFRVTNGIIYSVSDVQTKFHSKLNPSSSFNRMMRQIQDANALYIIVSEANKSLVVLDSKIDELSKIVHANDLQKYANFSQINSTLMLDTNFVSSISDTEATFKDYYPKIDIIMKKARENYATLTIQKNELFAEISRSINSLEDALISFN